jgi:hypothetical protein
MAEVYAIRNTANPDPQHYYYITLGQLHETTQTTYSI